MTTEITTSTYQRLDFYIDQIKIKMLEGEDLLVTYWKVATEEEQLEPKEAWKYLTDKLADSIVPRRTLYRWADKVLPDGIKQNTKPKKIATWQSPEQETNFNTEGMGVVEVESESASTSATDSDGQEVEREIEQPIVASDNVMLERLKEENKQLRQVISNQQFIKASDIEQKVDKRFTILPHNKVLDLCKKRMEMGLNGFMRLEDENGIVVGIEVVNVVQ